MQRDASALLDVVNAAKYVVAFVEGYTWERFDADVKTQSAVLHQIILLGEAVKRLSADFRSAHPEIPWREVAGMRDRVIHQYDDVDLDQVWDATQKDVPLLLRKLRPLMPPEEASDKRI